LIIKRIDGISIDDIVQEVQFEMEPPYNDRHRIEHITSDEILSLIYGKPGTEVSITFSDGLGEVHEKRIRRESRDGKTKSMIGFPATFGDFEARFLENDIGYLRFNWFHPALTQKLPDAIDSMEDSSGLIIDLRGNPGGMREVAITTAESLVDHPIKCSRLIKRNGFSDIVLEPEGRGYSGPVVVMIDVMSKSSSEFFAACMQSIDRAVIIGERSPGSVGPAKMIILPNMATFLYPDVQERTLDGTVLEDHGVIPDIEVTLDREMLLKGVDSQLEVAIENIKMEMRGNVK
jgi:carboxyl-terminal processing protease